jgi:hypothetical protein
MPSFALPAVPFAIAPEPAVEAFIHKWQAAPGSELSNSQSFIMDLCALLGVERPHATADWVDAQAAALVLQRKAEALPSNEPVTPKSVLPLGPSAGQPVSDSDW